MSVVEAAVDGGSSSHQLSKAKLELGNGELTSEEDLITRSDGSTESSSIGQPDNDKDNDDDEVQSSLSSLASLEDSLPTKKGLSKFYGGKSKSFGNLGEAKNVKELVKSENPFNKRRRTLMAYNLMFKSGSKEDKMMMNKKKKSFYSHSNHISMPLLPLTEQHDDDDDNQHDSADYYAPPPLRQIKEQPYINSFYPTTTCILDVALDRS